MNINAEDIFVNYISNIVPSPYFTNGGVCSDSSLLYEPFRIMVHKGLDDYEEVNPDNDVPFLYETFRSHALQQAYYLRGGLTGIRGGSILNCSMHHLGVATDIINLRDKNGNKAKDPSEVVDWTNLNYTTLQKIMDKYNLTHLKFEACHFQAVTTADQSNLRSFVFKRMKEWQEYNGLVADGIVGPNTIKKAKERYL